MCKHWLDVLLVCFVHFGVSGDFVMPSLMIAGLVEKAISLGCFINLGSTLFCLASLVADQLRASFVHCLVWRGGCFCWQDNVSEKFAIDVFAGLGFSSASTKAPFPHSIAILIQTYVFSS